jgi:hypothetical protein
MSKIKCDLCAELTDPENIEQVVFSISQNAIDIEPSKSTFVCQDCLESHVSICDDCGLAINTEDDFFAVDIGCHTYCDNCISNNVVYVESDDQWYPIDDTFHCTDCNDPHHCDEANHTYSGDYVCEGCCDEFYRYCDDVHEFVHIDDVHYCEDDECYYYYSENCRDSNGLRSWDYNVLGAFSHNCIVNGTFSNLRDNHKRLFLGLEIETDTRDGHRAGDLAEAIEDIIEGYAICKSDATCTGPEIVTLPGDLKSHQFHFPYDDMCRILRPIARGFHGEDNGMHIHATRAAMSELTIGKLLVFMHSEENLQFIRMIAQRDFDRINYCKVPNTYSEPDRLHSVGKCGKRPVFGKYSAINVTDSTLEFRIFKSHLTVKRILKNVEFVHAIIKWAEKASVKNLSHISFINYVIENRKLYRNLSLFIADRFRPTQENVEKDIIDSENRLIPMLNRIQDSHNRRLQLCV